jgi:hypothetical protein
MLASNRPAITPDVSSPIPDEDDGPFGYHERKVMGLCTYPGCSARVDDHNECTKHRAGTAKRKAKWRAKRARIARKLIRHWRKKKRCLGCGGKRLSGEDHCAKCTVAIGAAQLVVSQQAGQKEARIEAATTVDADGRWRYRGQAKRGRQSVAQLDDQDLRFALEALQKARDGIAWLSTVTDSAMSKNEKHDAVSAALAHATHASRLVDDVLDRHGYFKPIAPEPKTIKR